VNATTKGTLEQLRGKYVEMLSMRVAHDSGIEDDARARQRMAELAARFPGALREIDELELEVIRDRIDRLDAVLRGDAVIERWMEAIGLFHALARGALKAKRWLAGRKSVDPSTVLEYESHVAAGWDALSTPLHGGALSTPPQGGALSTPPQRGVLSTPLQDAQAYAADALAWAAELGRIAAPPRGRIMDLVFARVAQALGTTELEARYLVFGPPRRAHVAHLARPRSSGSNPA
jgi:hypothetical protein